MTMLERLQNDYDWREAFAYAQKPQPILGEGDWEPKGYGPDDIAEVIAAEDGENDELDWVGLFRMKDGWFLALRAGCDFTGWDCQAGGDSQVAKTSALAIRYALTDEERDRLCLFLEDEL